MAEAAEAYIALKRMKVHERDEAGEPILDADTGRPVLRELAPGDTIPGAADWRNLWREIKAGRVAPAGTPLEGGNLAMTKDRRTIDARAAARKRTAKGARKKASGKRASRKRGGASQSASGPALPSVAPATGASPLGVSREGTLEG